MSKSASAKRTLATPITVPLDKLVIHPGNVRTIDTDREIDEFAADIALRGLLQSLSIRKLIDDDGEETATYGVQAGGRRLRALKLLVKQKKLAKNAPIPCLLSEDGFVEADSLAENTARAALHPLDQFRAFAALHDKGEGEDTIAAAFGVTAAIVKQRLRLTKASPILLKAYEDDAITLEQLMAFCLIEDHARQNEVWTAIQRGWDKSPRAVRRMLTEKTVAADDRRALLVGAGAYKAAGGLILRDLFDEDDGGWLQDVPLLERLAGEKLEAAAETIRVEGWKWVECAVEFPWNHKRPYLPVVPKVPVLTDAEQEEYVALEGERDELTFAEDDLKRLETVFARIEDLAAKAPVFDPKTIGKAGVFVSLDDAGKLVVDRGHIHPDDIKRPRQANAAADGDGLIASDEPFDPETGEIGGAPDAPQVTCDTDEDSGPAIPERLKIELTAYRSLALRDALANNFEFAFLAVLHGLVEKLFHRAYDCTSSLQIQANDTLTSSFPGLADFKANKAIDARHETWSKAMPERAGKLWDWLASLDRGNREALFAHCAGLTVNAVHQPHLRCDAKMGHADTLARSLGADMDHWRS